MSELAPTPSQRRHLPLGLKLALTAFVGVQVVIYWSEYGPTNFLYFCDIALFLTLLTVLTEYRLPASMAAVGILLPQFLWVIDFVGGIFGHPFFGMTGYMFQDSSPLYARAISLFHGWLPFLLLYLIWRLGYDRRALFIWTVVAWGLMLIAYFWLPAPPAPAANPNLPVNVNYVYGPRDDKPQQWMPQLAWLGLMFVGLPILLYLPTHLILKTWRGFLGQRDSILANVSVDAPRNESETDHGIRKDAERIK